MATESRKRIKSGVAGVNVYDVGTGANRYLTTPPPARGGTPITPGERPVEYVVDDGGGGEERQGSTTVVGPTR